MCKLQDVYIYRNLHFEVAFCFHKRYFFGTRSLGFEKTLSLSFPDYNSPWLGHFLPYPVISLNNEPSFSKREHPQLEIVPGTLVTLICILIYLNKRWTILQVSPGHITRRSGKGQQEVCLFRTYTSWEGGVRCQYMITDSTARGGWLSFLWRASACLNEKQLRLVGQRWTVGGREINHQVFNSDVSIVHAINDIRVSTMRHDDEHKHVKLAMIFRCKLSCHFPHFLTPQVFFNIHGKKKLVEKFFQVPLVKLSTFAIIGPVVEL